MKGPEIASLRTMLGLTQVQLGQLLGVHPLTVSRWERNELTPTLHQQALLESFLKARRSKDDIGQTVANLLVTAGVVLALYALLRAAVEEK